MQRFGWEPVREGENIIGLTQNGASLSLEPGGQFELSGAPLKTVHETCAEVNTHLEQTREVASEIGAGVLGFGFAPNWTPGRNADDAQGPLQDHARLHAQGRRLWPGHDVPHLHRAGESRFRLRSRHGEEIPRRPGAAAGHHRAVRQFAVPRRQAQRVSVLPRARSGPTSTMPAPGMLPWVFEDGMSFERYVDYALDVPMYFVYRDGKYIDVAGKSFRDFLARKIPEVAHIDADA